jgi:hypothetical protein
MDTRGSQPEGKKQWNQFHFHLRMVGRYWQKQGQTKEQQSAFQPEKETKTPLCE